MSLPDPRDRVVAGVSPEAIVLRKVADLLTAGLPAAYRPQDTKQEVVPTFFQQNRWDALEPGKRLCMLDLGDTGGWTPTPDDATPGFDDAGLAIETLTLRAYVFANLLNPANVNVGSVAVGVGGTVGSFPKGSVDLASQVLTLSNAAGVAQVRFTPLPSAFLTYDWVGNGYTVVNQVVSLDGKGWAFNPPSRGFLVGGFAPDLNACTLGAAWILANVKPEVGVTDVEGDVFKVLDANPLLACPELVLRWRKQGVSRDPWKMILPLIGSTITLAVEIGTPERRNP